MFSNKFYLLNSQEHSEDIDWSSSSSDYENSSNNKSNSVKTKKRKRKRKDPKNTSNLEVVIVDSSKKAKSNVDKETSPVLPSKKVPCKSPILTSSRRIPRIDETSPILSGKFSYIKSPIIMLKYASPKSSVKVRKRLFYETSCGKSDLVGKSIHDISQNKFHINSTSSHTIPDINKNKIQDESSRTELVCSDSDISSKSELIDKVRKFFDSNFSSDTISQNISDPPTPEDSSKSEDIEILSCRTQILSNNVYTKQESADSSDINKCSKKVKYKKGGLAHKLNVLLKKRNANIRLWQHEHFLASNSNFVIPNGEHLLFHIQKSYFKYGCYLLEAMNVNDEKYFILINNCYVTENLNNYCVLKLYEPFQILDNAYRYCKLIINVCKFEVVNFQKQL